MSDFLFCRPRLAGSSCLAAVSTVGIKVLILRSWRAITTQSESSLPHVCPAISKPTCLPGSSIDATNAFSLFTSLKFEETFGTLHHFKFNCSFKTRPLHSVEPLHRNISQYFDPRRAALVLLRATVVPSSVSARVLTLQTSR